MSQDGWGETPYKKKAPRKKVVKGCPGNDGKAHLYEVTKIWTVIWNGRWSFRYLRGVCLLCQHLAPPSPRSPKHEVVRTQVRRGNLYDGTLTTVEYEGDTDQDGCPTPQKDF